MNYHQSVYIHPEAKIGENVKIHPFTYIDGDVEIGDECEIGPNASILNGARIGNNCKIYPGAVISAEPQDLKYSGEKTTAEIGSYTTIRECVTINKGTSFSSKTVVGSNCLIMAYCHIAHDCVIGNHVIMCNCANLAGHVVIEDYVTIEGIVAIQQFVHIGMYSFVAGGSLVRKNVPPYVKVAKEPLMFIGVNKIGLQRRGFDQENINRIEQIYKLLFVKGLNVTNATKAIIEEVEDSVEKEYILNFIKTSNKGIIKGRAKNGNTTK
ncbi:UNVERIFIED_CONTAM: hypothetical protein GTU68_033109 [Idotea baltica]|nr:hypothetical protein [Idotea baltica]